MNIYKIFNRMRCSCRRVPIGANSTIKAGIPVGNAIPVGSAVIPARIMLQFKRLGKGLEVYTVRFSLRDFGNESCSSSLSLLGRAWSLAWKDMRDRYYLTRAVLRFIVSRNGVLWNYQFSPVLPSIRPSVHSSIHHSLSREPFNRFSWNFAWS